ncbi:hypothetical protein cypCar_00015269 [Cyprinus carpio]|nr:hypothetical protein cypCar_00015269 [Cyprinus carpio]
MEDPSDPSLSLLSSSKNHVSRDATNIIPPPSNLQDPVIKWPDTTSDSKSRKTSTPSPSTPVCPEDVECLTPVGSGKRTRVSVNKCRVRRKEFKTTSALKTHLLIHRQDGPQFCGVCQRAFKHHHQLYVSHMLASE